MTDLGGASVTLGYNALKELERNEAALDAIVQHISRSTTVDDVYWIDDDNIAPFTIRIDLRKLKPLLLQYCLFGKEEHEFLEPSECNIIFEFGEHSIVEQQEEWA